jgi:hypothetical protein
MSVFHPPFARGDGVLSAPVAKGRGCSSPPCDGGEGFLPLMLLRVRNPRANRRGRSAPRTSFCPAGIAPP